jgi:hypothetical protein
MCETAWSGTLESMAGDRADTAEIEDVLDRLEVWHRGASSPRDTTDGDRSEVPARR